MTFPRPAIQAPRSSLSWASAAGFLFFILSGCSMSPEQMAVEIKRCESLNLRALPLINNLTWEVSAIRCWPKETDK